MKRLLIIASILCICTASFAQKQKQGICGKVIWVSGNQMPGPDKELASSKGIVREIVVYEVTTNEQATQGDGFCKDIKTKLVARTKSKKNGTFSVGLPTGTYSVFVVEEKGLWANNFDGHGRINPVTISDNNWVNLTLEVNYEASY
jgi:hypothetical protein